MSMKRISDKYSYLVPAFSLSSIFACSIVAFFSFVASFVFVLLWIGFSVFQLRRIGTPSLMFPSIANQNFWNGEFNTFIFSNIFLVSLFILSVSLFFIAIGIATNYCSRKKESENGKNTILRNFENYILFIPTGFCVIISFIGLVLFIITIVLSISGASRGFIFFEHHYLVGISGFLFFLCLLSTIFGFVASCIGVRGCMFNPKAFQEKNSKLGKLSRKVPNYGFLIGLIITSIVLLLLCVFSIIFTNIFFVIPIPNFQVINYYFLPSSVFISFSIGASIIYFICFLISLIPLVLFFIKKVRTYLFSLFGVCSMFCMVSGIIISMILFIVDITLFGAVDLRRINLGDYFLSYYSFKLINVHISPKIALILIMVILILWCAILSLCGKNFYSEYFDKSNTKEINENNMEEESQSNNELPIVNIQQQHISNPMFETFDANEQNTVPFEHSVFVNLDKDIKEQLQQLPTVIDMEKI